MNLIEVKNLTLTYDSRTIAAENLNFQVEEGDYLCIVGQNGAGKSSLIKGLLQLIRPAGGEIILNPSLDPRDIGYLPQQTTVQRDFPASVREVVLSGCLNRMGHRPFFGSREKKLARENMEQMGIYSLRNRCYRDLSGGQQQRVLLARALCATKKILLLDEPAAGLDPVVTQELYDLIERVNREMGITIIMVSHDISQSLRYARHILQLSRRQLFYGTTEEYRKSDVGRKFIHLAWDAAGADFPLPEGRDESRSMQNSDTDEERSESC